jgi:signal transduction histidine kinase
LQDARRLVDDTLNGLPCAVVVVDREGAVQRVNEQLVRLVRASAQVPVVGQDAARLLAPWTPNDAPHWSLLMERALQGVTPVSSEVQGPGGDQHLVGLVPLVDDHGVAQGLIICLTDITSLRRAEQHRAELLGFIAHDIRSPQASLVSLVQLQRMNPSSMSYEEVLAHVDTLAHSTLTLCEELLQIMRSESRPLRREAMDLVTIIDQARSEAQPQALARHITLIWTWPEGQHAELMGDASQLKRALMNLLSNAIKFSPEHTSVTIALASRPGQWVLSVSDQGPGITQADVSRLFKRYERIESDEPLRLAPGIGLGLVFVDTVIKRHGGQIRVISAPGQGATFEWTLPAE